VAVFVPLGILLQLLMLRPRWWKALLTSAAVSLTIELLQLAAQKLFSGGHVADVNDFIFLRDDLRGHPSERWLRPPGD
jgi:glycopeptide antibiotics resistance protein